jgi:hypothetical protein
MPNMIGAAFAVNTRPPIESNAAASRRTFARVACFDRDEI